MNNSIYCIALDIRSTDFQTVLYCKYGDTARAIHIVLREGLEDYPISDGCSAVFCATKTDGTIIYNDCTIEGNVIKYEFTEQTTSAEGVVECEVSLYGADGQVLTSPKFTLMVDEKLVGEEDVVSEDERNEVHRLLAEATESAEVAKAAEGNAAKAATEAKQSAKVAEEAISTVSIYTDSAKKSAEEADSSEKSAASFSKTAQSAAEEAVGAADAAKALADTLQNSIDEVNIKAEVIEGSLTRAEAAADTLESSLSNAKNAAADAARSAGEAKEYSQMAQQSTVVANSVKSKVFGKTIVINDAYPLEHVMDVKVSSKNLFDISKVDDITHTGGTIQKTEDNTLIVESTEGYGGTVHCGKALRVLAPELEVGKTYTISFVSTNTATGEPSRDQKILLIAASVTWNNGSALTITEDMLGSIFTFWTSGSSTSATVSNIQIEEGSVATDYTPYIDDVSTITLSRCGKNLFSNDVSKIKQVSYYNTSGTLTQRFGYAIPLPAGKYMLSVTNLNSENIYIAGSVCRNGVNVNNSSITNGFNTHDAYIIAGTVNYSPIMYTLEGEGNVLYIYNVVGSATIDATKDLFSNLTIQLEAGDKVTEYEPSEFVQYTPNSDGVIDGVTSLYPTTYLFTDTEGVRIDCEYIKVMGVDYGVAGGTQAIKNAIKLSELEVQINNDGGNVGGGGTTVQSDWNQTDSTKSDYIKNKPEIPSVEGLATEEYVDNAVEGLATEEYVNEKFSSVSGGGTVESTTNLLAPENLSKWTIIRESDNPETPADQPYSHYAGVVDMSNEGIEGISGILTQLATNSYGTYWTDFKYSEKLSLGDDFTVKLTPVIKNYKSAGTQIYNDSYVDVKFGNISIRLFRWARDMYQNYKNWPVEMNFNGNNFYKLRVGLCQDIYDSSGQLIEEDYLFAYTDIISTYPNSSVADNYPTTTLYDGKPASKTDLGNYKSNIMTYVRSLCTAQNGHIYAQNEACNFGGDCGWKDINIVVKDNTLKVLDANGDAFSFKSPQYNSDYTIADEIEIGSIISLINPESGEPALTFDNLDVRVRCHHDNQVTIYHPTALMRFEITKNNPEDVVEDIYNIADTANRQSAESALRFEGSVTDIREISDALLVDFDNPKSAINARSWSTTWYTLNIPSNIHGIRHPIMKFSQIVVGQTYWMVRITEVSPTPGRQWYNVYNESSEEWSGWYCVNSIKS